jgi:hypothetical protein
MSINFHRTSRVRRLIATALGLAVAFGVSGAILVFGQPAQAQAVEAQATAPAPGIASLRALEQLGNLVNGHHTDITAALEPGLRSKLPPERIDRDWATYQRQFGAYRSHGLPRAIPQGDVTVVDVPLGMARQPGLFRVVYNQAGQIVGFFLLRP